MIDDCSTKRTFHLIPAIPAKHRMRRWLHCAERWTWSDSCQKLPASSHMAEIKGGGEESIFFIGKAAIFFGQKMTSEPKEETLIFDPSWTRTSRPCQDKHCSNVTHLISPWFASLLLGDELPITADPMSKAPEHSVPYFQKRTGWISQPPRRWKSQIRPK